MDVYTDDSTICRAALHAGVIGRTGGEITLMPEPGRDRYAGITRNGVRSVDWVGQQRGSYRFLPGDTTPSAPSTPAQAAAPAGPAQPPSAPPAASAQTGACPDRFSAFRGTGQSLRCACSAEAAASGTVFGMDLYTDDSTVCRAALHAGVIGRNGGDVVVIAEAGRDRYVGITRNGVRSVDWVGQQQGSYRFEAPARPVLIDGTPAQQPIAEALRTTGQAQLYIQFRFDSAELDPAAEPVLNELLAAMRGDPSLRLNLIGHTDSVGQRAYNRTLSQRRAQSVVTWLRTSGIAANRLSGTGRGMDEPIADNRTEEGRALNRRVQALRVR